MNAQTLRPALTLHDPAVDAMQQLARVLDRIGDALAAVDATALLAVETELVGMLAKMDAVTRVDDRTAARAASRQASTALVRCRRLGASFSGVTRALARGGRAADGYDCMGGYVERAAPVSVLVRA
jgi:hypothetical protein